MSDANSMQPKWRTFVIVTVALAYPVAETGYEVGAYGELFFDKKLAAWITVTATLVALLVMPKHTLPVSRLHFWILAIPSVWMIGRFVIGVSQPGALVHPVLFVAGIVSFVFCVPYAVYIVVRIANPDLPQLRGPRQTFTLIAIAIAFFVVGYATGVRKALFLTCPEFRAYELEKPENCGASPSSRL